MNNCIELVQSLVERESCLTLGSQMSRFAAGYEQCRLDATGTHTADTPLAANSGKNAEWTQLLTGIWLALPMFELAANSGSSLMTARLQPAAYEAEAALLMAMHYSRLSHSYIVDGYALQVQPPLTLLHC